MDHSQNGIEVDSWLDQIDPPESSPDCLGREAFVKALGNAIVRMPSSRSAVTAVFGPWGSGKTWLLERVVENLENDHSDEIDVCRFSPWELKSDEQILVEFFTAISKKIPRDGRSKKLATLWDRLEQYALIGSLGFGGVASAIQLGGGADEASVATQVALQAGFGSISKLFGVAKKSSSADSMASRKTLSDLKSELSEELQKKLVRPILVVIDDLDRLEDKEIQLMIRLLNTTANLPKMHYLIFGDRMQISSALDPVCGGNGDRYLEKLVHNSFQVPEPGESQLRTRLWSGVERIAAGVTDDVVYGKRFTETWDAFLKFRIRNFRDCHRLLRTLSFHAGALTREGALEVDLIDLLSVDFLRVFDPSSYHRLSSEIPTNLWCFANLSGKEKSDNSIRIIELIENSDLGYRVICGVLLNTFPHLGEYIQKFLKENQLHMLQYGRSSHQISPLSICNFDRSEIYFRLDAGDSNLPESRVKEFIGASDDDSKMIDLLQGYRQRGWLVQLFARLKSDSDLIKDGAAAEKILFSLLSVSDDLEYKTGLEDNELGTAFDLADILIEKMARSGIAHQVVPAINRSCGLSVSLMIVEKMRHAASFTYFEGAKPSRESVKLTSGEIEKVSNKLFEKVKKCFAEGGFMKQEYDPSRAYRMAHALGPERTEKVLKFAVRKGNPEKLWLLLESLAISIMPSIRLDSWADPAMKHVEESELLNHLTQFGSIDFWASFLEKNKKLSISPLSKNMVTHLERFLKKKPTDD